MSIEITLTRDQATAIQMAPVAGAHGSSERIKLKLDIHEAFKAAGPEAEAISFSASRIELKSWALGCIAGWSQEGIAVRGGMSPLTDGDRNLLRLSAKALNVWGYVQKSLPKVEDSEDFEVDVDDSIELDSSGD